MKIQICILFLITSITQVALADNFVYCSEASPKIFNPQLASDGTTFDATRVLYGRLIDIEQGTTKLIPGIASSWTTSKDGLKYTFKIKKDIPFHTTNYFKPTRTLNADDILWTFNRMHSKNHSYHKVNGGAYGAFHSMGFNTLLKEVKKINDYEVQFILTKKQAPFLTNIAHDFAGILSKEYGQFLEKKKQKEKIDLKPIGTGPFKFKKYVKDTTIRYQAHENYYKGPAKIKNLTFSITPESSVRFQKLKRGECHLVTQPSPIDLKLMQKHKKITLKEIAGVNVGYLAFNVEKKPLNDVRVRQAIRYALNRESYINTIYKGYAEVATNPIPPSLWSYNKSIKSIEYNVQKAKDLLKKAGYPNGFKVSLWTLPVSRPYNPNGKKMGELMQEDLKKIGINVELKTYKWATFLDKADKGEFEMIQLGWSGDSDPDTFLYLPLNCDGIEKGFNVSRWCNKKYHQLVTKAKSLTLSDKRKPLYMEAQKIFNQDVPWVPIAHAKLFKAHTSNVEGYKISPLGLENFYELSLKK